MLGSSFTGPQKDTGPKGAGEQTYIYICVYIYMYTLNPQTLNPSDYEKDCAGSCAKLLTGCFEILIQN